MGVAGLALLDEIGVLRDAAGIQVERHIVAPADCGYGPRVGHGHRLTASGVVRHRDHHQGDSRAPVLGQCLLETPDIHVALEGEVGLCI